MNREKLKELGLNDEQIEAVMKEHGLSVNEIKEKADKVDGISTQNEDLKQQIKDRDKQLDELGKKAKDSEELTAEIERLKDENKTATQELQDKLDKQSFDFALEKSLGKAGAKNPKAVKALLDTESIKQDGETLLGLDNQLKSLQESDSYLFEQEEPPGLRGRQPHQGGGNTPPTNKNPFSDEHFNLTEQGRLLKEDPELYKQLKAQAGK